MVDEQKLRLLAEAATPGPWISAGPSFGAEFPVYCNEVVVNREDDEDDTYGICQAPTCFDKESTEDMDYIAAANPAAILSLLDELQTLRAAVKQARIDALEEAKQAVFAAGPKEPPNSLITQGFAAAIESLKGTP